MTAKTTNVTNITKEELIGNATWEEAVTSRKVVPYFKPLRSYHESGYRNNEVGYAEMNGDKQVVIGRSSDHICFLGPLLREGKSPSFNMDVDRHGRIRVFRGFVWSDERALSSADLKYVGNLKDQ